MPRFPQETMLRRDKAPCRPLCDSSIFARARPVSSGVGAWRVGHAPGADPRAAPACATRTAAGVQEGQRTH